MQGAPRRIHAASAALRWFVQRGSRTDSGCILAMRTFLRTHTPLFSSRACSGTCSSCLDPPRPGSRSERTPLRSGAAQRRTQRRGTRGAAASTTKRSGLSRRGEERRGSLVTWERDATLPPPPPPTSTPPQRTRTHARTHTNVTYKTQQGRRERPQTCSLHHQTKRYHHLTLAQLQSAV